MAQGEGFKHITVTAAEDEDVVIHAGIARGDDDATAPATSGDDCVEATGDQHDAGEPDREADVARLRQPTRSRAKRDDYRETTLEDLQSLKMPLVQKIVIIAAVLCIIGAIAYCAVFMG